MRPLQPASFPNQPVYKYQLMEDRKPEENSQMLNVISSARSGLQEGKSLPAGTRVWHQEGAEVCAHLQLSRASAGWGEKPDCHIPRCMSSGSPDANSTVQRPLLEANLFTDRGGTKSLKPIPGWCWQGGRSVQQPGFPEQPGGWHTGSSSQPKGRPWRLGPQPVWAARLCAGSRPSLLNPERPGGEKPTHKWEQLSEVGPG